MLVEQVGACVIGELSGGDALEREVVEIATQEGIEGLAAEALFQRLRQWRLETARTQGVPPYVIFHDATLLAIAQARPRSRRALEGLPGLGAAKLERYADGLLAIVGDG
jgi:ATP-dependent DNA helicase RecQ